MSKCKCKAPEPKHERHIFMKAKTGKYRQAIQSAGLKVTCKQCNKLIGWYKSK